MRHPEFNHVTLGLLFAVEGTVKIIKSDFRCERSFLIYPNVLLTSY